MATIHRSGDTAILNGDSLCGPGIGAAYIRVSTDHQDTDRQYSAIKSFESQFEVTIPKPNWFEDHGWARDEADKRPEFQRMMKLAEAGAIQWIVVDKLDRFGTKNSTHLGYYLYRLERAGCRLLDASGKCWSGADIATILTRVVEAEKSKGEQTDKSHRVLGGKIEKARAGEWQGGPVRLGFDVACYDRATGKELWRVLIEGRNQRVKVWANGKTERFDGRSNFPKVQPTEVLRIAPSKDKAKVAAAVSVFKRFSTEAIGLTKLAHHLNGLGYRNGLGGMFQGHQVEALLEDPAYLGIYAWNKRHAGKFNRFTDGRIVLEYNYDEAMTKNAEADWIRSQRLFAPLVDQATWDAVQAKLTRPRRQYAPRSSKLYLAGLVHCANCGGRMVSGCSRNRQEYFCGTYHRSLRDGTREQCKCDRNSVFHSELEAILLGWFEESGKRLELLSKGLEDEKLTSPLRKRANEEWQRICGALNRVWDYLADKHPGDLKGLGNDWSLDQLLETYQRRFSPDTMDRQLQELEKEHDSLTQKTLNLPPTATRAIEKTQRQLVELETRIGQLEEDRDNAADFATRHLQEFRELSDSIQKAKAAMAGKGERGLRQRAEACGKVIDRIDCYFESTGKKGGGWGKKNGRLAKVVIHPKCGESKEIHCDSKGTVMYSSAHSFI